MREKHMDIDLDEKTVALGMGHGLIVYDAEQEVYVFTKLGVKVVEDYVRKALSEGKSDA